MDEIAVLRVLHIAGAVLLLGNVTVTGVWAAYLYRARSRVPFQPVARAILWTDLIFTVGGGTLLTVSGILLALRRSYAVAGTPWLLRGIAALGTATVLWLVVLLPAQLRMSVPMTTTTRCGERSAGGAWWDGPRPPCFTTAYGPWRGGVERS